MAVEDDFGTTPSPDVTSTQILKDIGVLDVGGTPTETIPLASTKIENQQVQSQDAVDEVQEVLVKGLNQTATKFGYYDGSAWKSYISSNGGFKFGGDTNYIEYNPTTDITTFTGSIVLDNFRSEGGTTNTIEGSGLDSKNYMTTSDTDTSVSEAYSIFPLFSYNQNTHKPWIGTANENYNTMGAYTLGTLSGLIGYASDSQWASNILNNFNVTDGTVDLTRYSVILNSTTMYLFNKNTDEVSVNLATEDYTDYTRWLKLNNPNYTVGTASNVQTVTIGQTVQLSLTNSVDGRAGHIYQAKVTQSSQDLLNINFLDNTNWIDTTRTYFRTHAGQSGVYGTSYYQDGLIGFSVYGTGISAFGGDIGIRCATTSVDGSAIFIDKHPDGATYTVGSRPQWSKPIGTDGTYMNVDNAGNIWIWDKPNSRWGLLPLS